MYFCFLSFLATLDNLGITFQAERMNLKHTKGIGKGIYCEGKLTFF